MAEPRGLKRCRTPAFEALEDNQTSVGAAITFVFTGSDSRRVVPLEDLLKGTSPGWLRSALAAADLNDELRVPDDMPLISKVEVRAFERLLGLVGDAYSKTTLQDMFRDSSELRFLPQTFQVAHRLGMEHAAAAIRAFFLQDPSVVLRQLKLKKGDAEVLSSALHLGLGRTMHKMPLRLCVAEKLDAVALALNGGARCDKIIDAECWHLLLELFNTACDLRLHSLRQEVIRALTDERQFCRLLSFIDETPSATQSAKTALGNGLDSKRSLRAVHVAASSGLLSTVQLAVGAGQAASAVDPSCGTTPLMLAAAGGHVEVLRWLARQKANVDAKNREGLRAVDFAAKNDRADAVRLLQGQFLHLASL